MARNFMHFKAKSNECKGQMFFIHGFATTSFYFWEFYQTYFSEHYDLYTVELPGMGINKNLPEKLNLEAYVQFIIDTFNENDLKNIILIGHSMGGGIVDIISNKIPERIKTSIMICPMNSSFSFKLINGFKLLETGGFNEEKAALKYLYVNPNAYFKDEIDTHVKNLQEYKLKNRSSLHALFKSFFSLKVRRTLKDAEDHNPIKSLAVFCVGDKIIDAYASSKRLAQNPNIDVQIINGSGHIPFHEQPEQLAKIITKWLEYFGI